MYWGCLCVCACVCVVAWKQNYFCISIFMDICVHAHKRARIHACVWRHCSCMCASVCVCVGLHVCIHEQLHHSKNIVKNASFILVWCMCRLAYMCTYPHAYIPHQQIVKESIIYVSVCMCGCVHACLCVDASMHMCVCTSCYSHRTQKYV